MLVYMPPYHLTAMNNVNAGTAINKFSIIGIFPWKNAYHITYVYPTVQIL